MTREKQNTTPSAFGTPYDDVYRTLITDCPSLVIPLVNEIFHEHLSRTEKVVPLENELFLNRQDGKQAERITDANLWICSRRYHLECQSNPDHTILLRIFEYDTQIALQDSSLQDNCLITSMPNTAVLYLRCNRTTPDKMKIIIQSPDKKEELQYTIPILKVGMYTIDEIFEKELYFLIPFYIFTHENNFKKYERDEAALHSLISEYEQILQKLEACAKQGLITEYIKLTIIDMSKKVLHSISRKYLKVKERVGDVMGGKVLDYEAKDILNQGKSEGIAIGKSEGIAIGKSEGIELGKASILISQIQAKLIKGKSIPEIADALEETEDSINQLIEKYNIQSNN